MNEKVRKDMESLVNVSLRGMDEQEKTEYTKALKKVLEMNGYETTGTAITSMAFDCGYEYGKTATKPKDTAMGEIEMVKGYLFHMNECRKAFGVEIPFLIYEGGYGYGRDFTMKRNADSQPQGAADDAAQQVNPLPEAGNDEIRKARVLRAIDEAWNRAERLQRKADAMESPEIAFGDLKKYFNAEAYAEGMKAMAILAGVFRDKEELERKYDDYFSWKYINRGRE